MSKWAGRNIDKCRIIDIFGKSIYRYANKKKNTRIIDISIFMMDYFPISGSANTKYEPSHKSLIRVRAPLMYPEQCGYSQLSNRTIQTHLNLIQFPDLFRLC